MMKTKPFDTKKRTAAFFYWILLAAAVFGASKSAVSDKAMVVAATPEATQAGLVILKLGGNAVDAAAACAFALMVTDPAMCSLGGRSQILIYLKDGKIFGIDGATQSPRMASEPAEIGHGYRTCAVPGSPAALEKMVNEHGSLPLKVILKPAIDLARNGFIVHDALAQQFQSAQNLFRLYPGTAAHFLKADGSTFQEGENFVQPALSRTLERIADSGTGILYRGSLASSIVEDMNANGGLIRADDLDQYRPLQGKILEGCYRGHRVISRGDQCNGASVIEMLHILEHLPLSQYGADNPAYLHLIAQVVLIGHQDELLPDELQVSRALALQRLREIDKEKPFPLSRSKTQDEKAGETNHISIIDQEGNAVSLTQSIGPTFGTKVVNPELGFFYGYSYDMNSDPVPFQREKTSQSPTIVFKDDKPYIILGSAGSSRIPPSIVQTIVNVIDRGMSLEEAVAAPRLFLAGEELRIEVFSRPDSLVKELEAFGYKIRAYDIPAIYFGRVNAILVDTKVFGASDPRNYGSAAGF